MRLQPETEHVRQLMTDKRIEARAYTREHGEDAPRDQRLELALLDPPGGPGESHPRAPTERSVKVSLHSARRICRLYLKSVIHAQCANSRGCLEIGRASC